jgi:hypothetical protein
MHGGALRAKGGGSAVQPAFPQAGVRQRDHLAHPVAGGALRAWEGARRCGIEMRVGPVGIANGSFGHRPHCVYRGYCLQGCKVNAKA